jgi:arylsulfatase A-like enzyme
MLGNHGQWAKRLFYEDSSCVPMILVGTADDERVGHHRIDNRLIGWQDIVPTLLDLAGIDIPESVEGISMVGEETRQHLYGECGNGHTTTRMIHDGRHKLIYYPVGNRAQLFDLEEDPKEINELKGQSSHARVEHHLRDLLAQELYGGDEEWVKNGEWIGLPDRKYVPSPNRGLSGQRGSHWPVPPQTGGGSILSLT